MTDDDLQTILDDHGKWLRCDGGKMADLTDANLRRADLTDADLRRADLRRADLRRANLSHASLRRADLTDANLRRADLSRANLTDANLTDANLSHADLTDADLTDADLTDADLRRANLAGATLTCTCLDPEAAPNGNGDGFERDGEHVIGYRSRKAGHIPEYKNGRHYSADVFSVSDSSCHPGLYLWPTAAAASTWLANYNRAGEELIRVRTRPEHIHKAGHKWRCREFYVAGTAALEKK